MTDSSTPSRPDRTGAARPGLIRELISRITRLEIIVGAVIALILLVLIVIEPKILEAPFENERTLLFTVGGTALAAVALVAMLRFGVPPAVRLGVLVVPFLIVNWWLISPYFIDDVVDEGFSASISDQITSPQSDATTASGAQESTTTLAPTTTTAPPTTLAAQEDPADSTDEPATTLSPTTTTTSPPTTATTAPSGPVLLGFGQFIGLAGHTGTGDAGIFQNPDGSYVLRFENFDIQNGPDLEVYLVPGVDQVSLSDGSIHLGALKGNIGDQNYELPSGIDLGTGAYTALVWCEAFSVEFVGATIHIGG